jgi:imidazolonepropionase-like amidohydrolase
MLASRAFRALVFAALAGVAATGVQAETVVLRDFTLIDGTGRAPVRDSALVIENGRITWVGPVLKLKVPAGATPVDYSGKYVIPGMIDLHVHLGNVVDLKQNHEFFTRDNVERDLKTYAAYGVTTVLSLGTDSDLIFAVRSEQRASRPTMTRVYTAGQGFVFKGGYGGLAGVNKPLASVSEVDAAVAEQAGKGVDIIKLWLDDEFGDIPKKMPFEMTKAIIDAAHAHHLRAVAHVFYLEDAKRLVEQGIDGLAHSVRDRPVDEALIEAMKPHETWQFAATLSREASMFAYGQRAPFLDDPFFTRAVSAESLRLLADPEHQRQLASNPHFSAYPSVLSMAQGNLKRLARGGVKYGLGTDSGPPGRFPGYFAHWELQLMVGAGLTPAQALGAATRDAAEFLRAKDIGTLERSKWADLVVLDADPLVDIKNTRAIRAVYIAGRPVQTSGP